MSEPATVTAYRLFAYRLICPACAHGNWRAEYTPPTTCDKCGLDLSVGQVIFDNGPKMTIEARKK